MLSACSSRLDISLPRRLGQRSTGLLENECGHTDCSRLSVWGEGVGSVGGGFRVCRVCTLSGCVGGVGWGEGEKGGGVTSANSTRLGTAFLFLWLPGNLGGNEGVSVCSKFLTVCATSPS